MHDLFDLTGKTALVTGSTSGIGLAIAEAFAAAGARVAVSSIDAPACASVAAALAGAEGFACDVTDQAQLDALPGQVEARLGPIDILVVNAGGQAPPDGTELSVNSAGFEATMRLNLWQAVRLSDLTAPGMAERGGGSIILMASVGGIRGNKGVGPYAMAKAALAQLARNLAVQWGPRNVRSNAIAPGLILTPMTAPMADNPEALARRMQMTPLRRPGQPHEVAGAALFLAGKGGAYVNGHTLVVDGGTVITDGS